MLICRVWYVGVWWRYIFRSILLLTNRFPHILCPSSGVANAPSMVGLFICDWTMRESISIIRVDFFEHTSHAIGFQGNATMMHLHVKKSLDMHHFANHVTGVYFLLRRNRDGEHVTHFIFANGTQLHIRLMLIRSLKLEVIWVLLFFMPLGFCVRSSVYSFLVDCFLDGRCWWHVLVHIEYLLLGVFVIGLLAMMKGGKHNEDHFNRWTHTSPTKFLW